MITPMPLGGEYGAWAGPMKPSGEWRIHLDIARARPDVGAIVRFQSPYATALAMARRSIPAAHSMIALFGSPVIRCANYAPFGTKELAVLALEGLGEGHAVLLGNYGALDHRRFAGGGAGAGDGAGNPRKAIFDRSLRRAARHAFGRGGRTHRRALEVLRRRHRGADRANAKAKAKAKAKTPAKGKRVASKRGAKKKSPRRKAAAVNASLR